MRARRKDELATLRMVLSEIKQREIDGRCQLSEGDVTGVLTRMVKQRKDALGQFEQAGRDDLADKERQEIDIIRSYLPEQLSEDQLRQLITDVIVRVQAGSPRDMGKVMGMIKAEASDRVDMTRVSRLVKEQLTTIP